MEKLMWAGFWIEIIMLITMFILVFLQQQVPDLVDSGVCNEVYILY